MTLTRLIGTKDIHAAEVFDGVQPADDDTSLRHALRSMSERDADDGRQKFRRQTDGQTSPATRLASNLQQAAKR